MATKYIPIGKDHEVTRARPGAVDDQIGYDRRARALGQGDTGVVGIALNGGATAKQIKFAADFARGLSTSNRENDRAQRDEAREN
jgi:hypothetical protein